MSMVWIFIALTGYFFNAVASILDKYILSAKNLTPSVYAFFVAIFSVFVIVLAPFGLHGMPLPIFLLALVSGMFFVYGLVFFYQAVLENEISQVAPLMGSLMAIVALLYSMLAQVLLHGFESIRISEYSTSLLSFVLLLAGGLLVTFNLPLQRADVFRGIRNTFFASIFLISSLIMLKYIYDDEGFISGFIWSRMGLCIGGLSLFLVPKFRHEIILSLHGMRTTTPTVTTTGIWFLVNKTAGSLGNTLVQYALSIGSLVVVQVLSSVQFAFVFLLIAPLSMRFPKLFHEKFTLSNWIQKGLALILIGIGIYFSSISGAKLFV